MRELMAFLLFIFSFGVSRDYLLTSTNRATSGRADLYWDKGVVEGKTYKNASIGIEFTPSSGLEFGKPELKGTPGTLPLLVTITALKESRSFAANEVTAFYAEALRPQSPAPELSDAYMRKVLHDNKVAGYAPVGSRSNSILEGVKFKRQDFQKSRAYEAVFLKVCGAKAVVFIFGASTVSDVNKLIAGTEIRLNLPVSRCSIN